MSESKITPTDGIIIHPHYQTAHAQITEPTRFVAMSHYYRRRWLRAVGPVGTAILLELRGRCYNNPVTGERRDFVVAAQRELAESIGISVDTLQRHLGKPGRDDDPKANRALRHFIWTEERYERSETGRVRQLENVYHVAMDDPVHEDDAERLEALVEEYEQQAVEAAERQRQHRKQIIPARGHVMPEAGITPEPQNAVLRPGAEQGTFPLPQNAAGGHRKMRQGSPQNAALSEESLLLFTRVFTESTLNVGEEASAFVSSGENKPPLPEPSASRNSLEADIAASVEALTQELKDQGSERRHKQLLSVCEQHGLLHLSGQALQATRRRLAKEGKQGLLEKPGAYYQRVLIKLLENHQVFVPTAGEDDAEEVRRLAIASLGLEDPSLAGLGSEEQG